jgi:ATP-binding cassette subfamily B protein
VKRIPKTYEENEDQLIQMARGNHPFMRMIREISRNRRDFRLLVLSIIITAATSALYPYALDNVVNGIVNRRLDLIVIFTILFFSFYLIQFFSNRLRTITSTRLAQGQIKSMRDGAFRNLQRVPLDFYSSVKTGYLISRITNDGEALSEFLTFQLPQVVSGVSTIFVAVSFMFYLDFSLTLYSLIIIPVIFLFSFSIQKKVRKLYLRTRRTIAAITGNVAENLSAVHSIKGFNIEDYIENRFDGLNRDNFNANIRASRLSSIYGSILRVLEALGIFIVLIVGTRDVLLGLTSIGILVAFVVYVQEFFDPVTQLSQLYNSYQSAMVAIIRIYGIMDSPAEPSIEKTATVAQFKDSVEARELGVSYGSKWAIRGLNFNIKKGDRIAIVGHTGAGKTTLSNVILKFIPPSEGDILLDGVSLGKINNESYRSLLAPVLQEPFLFRGSVLDNIAFSVPGISREKVIEAVKKYGLLEIFDTLPRGLDTEVGEAGRNLSEGQRQSISLLRAFIREPEILILDEATAQIDPGAETRIIDALKGFMGNRTLILITHRFSLISLVNSIMVLENGSLVQEVSFGKLMSTDGLFRDLYRIQRNLD